MPKVDAEVLMRARSSRKTKRCLRRVSTQGVEVPPSAVRLGALRSLTSVQQQKEKERPRES